MSEHECEQNTRSPPPKSRLSLRSGQFKQPLEIESQPTEMPPKNEPGAVEHTAPLLCINSSILNRRKTTKITLFRAGGIVYNKSQAQRQHEHVLKMQRLNACLNQTQRRATIAALLEPAQMQMPTQTHPTQTTQTTTSHELAIPHQLDKRQRFDMYMRRLLLKPACKTTDEAIELINKTLDEIEDKYAPKKDNKLFTINSKRFGRMNPVPKDRIKLNPETGKTEMYTTGLTVYVSKNGSFEIWTVSRGASSIKKIFFKNGAK